MRGLYLISCLFVLVACSNEESLSEKVEGALRNDNLVLAEQILQDEINKDNAEAKALLAWLILSRQTPSTVNFKSTGNNKRLLDNMAMPLLEEASDQGSPMAQYLLAKIVHSRMKKPGATKKFNELMQRSAAQGFLPAILIGINYRPLIHYGSKNNKYLLIDLKNSPLRDLKEKNINCQIDPFLPVVSETYLYKIESELTESKEATVNLITNAAKCLVIDLDRANHRLDSDIPYAEGKIFDNLFHFLSAQEFSDKGGVFQNPDVLVALGGIFTKASARLNDNNINFNKVDENKYETVSKVQGIEFYYQAIINASNHSQFVISKEQALKELLKMADKGSLTAKRKVALLPNKSSQLTDKDKIEKIKSVAKSGDPISMRKLGQIYLANNEKEKAIKWLQYAAYSHDNEAMEILSDVWENSDDPNEQILGALWGQFVAELGASENQMALYSSSSPLEIQEISDFLMSLGYDARGKEIPNKIFDAGLELYEARTSKRLQKKTIVINSTIKPKNNELKEFELRAEQGDLFAITELGKYYYEGNGVAQNKERAFRLYQKARRSGNEADKILKILAKYDSKIKSLINEQTFILETYEKKAKLGNVFAINYLIKAYSTGVDAPYAPKKADYYQNLLKKVEANTIQSY